MKIEQLLMGLNEANPMLRPGSPVKSKPNLRVEPGGKSDAPSGEITKFGTVGAARAASKAQADVARAYQSSIDAGRVTQRIGSTSSTTGGSATTGSSSSVPFTTTATTATNKGQGESNGNTGSGTTSTTSTSIIKGIGDIAAQTVGGVAQTLGAIPGGLVHGYKAARAGQKFGGGGTAGVGGTTGSSTDEVNRLISMLRQMDARLRRAGI